MLADTGTRLLLDWYDQEIWDSTKDPLAGTVTQLPGIQQPERNRIVYVGGPHCPRELGTGKSQGGGWRVLRVLRLLTDNNSLWVI